MSSKATTIPMVDLLAQYKSIKKEIDGAINGVITSSAYVGGKYIEQFEKNIAKFIGTKYAITLNSGTDALYLSLWALGVKEGDEVITTPFTFFATAEVAVRLGAKVVFADIDPETFDIDPKEIEKKITKKTKAIIPVHLFGYPANMDAIMKLAKKHKIAVVEDACQSIGAKYKGKMTGTIGDTGAFSFFPSKNLGAYGDGGMVTTDDKKLAEKMILLRNHGSIVKYYNDEIGVSSRLDGIQAAILDAKLKHLKVWIKERNRVAKTYNKLLKNIDWIELPNYEIDSKTTHVYHQYTLKVKNGNRDALQKYLAGKGIASMIYYPVSLHQLKAMKPQGYKTGDLPASEHICKEVLSLPIYPEMKESAIKIVVKEIENFQKKSNSR